MAPCPPKKGKIKMKQMMQEVAGGHLSHTHKTFVGIAYRETGRAISDRTTNAIWDAVYPCSDRQRDNQSDVIGGKLATMLRGTWEPLP